MFLVSEQEPERLFVEEYGPRWAYDAEHTASSPLGNAAQLEHLVEATTPWFA